MEYILSKHEMETCDKNTSEYLGVNELVLMENAARYACDVLLEQINYNKGKKILILCGTGNNGGDGFCLGRILKSKGYQVKLGQLGREECLKESAKKQYEICKKYDIEISNIWCVNEYDVIVDGIFGIGLTRDITGAYFEAIKECNENETSLKLALDIPSGLCSDTGAVLGICFKADITVTFGYKKLGHYLGLGKIYCGKLFCNDIGITNESFLGETPKGFCYQKEDLKFLPRKSVVAHKGSHGKILVIAGSQTISGAAYLSGYGALKMGAGYIRIFTPKENREILSVHLPHAIIETYDCDKMEETLADLERLIKDSSFVIIGPGMGKSTSSKQIVKTVIATDETDVLFDADALNIICEDKLDQSIFEMKHAKIITPHIKEGALLLQKEIKEVKRQIVASAMLLAKQFGCICALKDATTVVSNGENYYINTSGNEGMAVMGSGDVLTGIMGALVSSSSNCYETVCLSVFAHGFLGDIAKKEQGSRGMLPTDLLNYTKELL